MPKHEFIWQCDTCKKYIVEGIEAGLLVFCNEKCHEKHWTYGVHSSAARTSDSKSEDGGSSPPEPATIPDEVFERMAIGYLVDNLQCDVDDPDFPRWKDRCTVLFRRYHPLSQKCPRPLGNGWPDDDSEVIDECLDMLERKIKAAEDILGLTT